MKWRDRRPTLNAGTSAVRYYNAAMLPDAPKLDIGLIPHVQGVGQVYFRSEEKIRDLMAAWSAARLDVAGLFLRIGVPIAQHEGPTR